MSAVMLQQPAPAVAERHNIYRIIHKALRAFMSDTLVRIGRVDAGDEAECAEAAAQLHALLDVCSGHLHHEDEFLHAAIERATPRGSARTDADHRDHEAAIAGLRAQAAAFAAAQAADRPALAQRLYLELSEFVAENFAHMVVEEVDNHALLIAAYDEGEVLALEQRLVASLPPEEKAVVMRWMLPHANARERAYLLGGAKRHAPPEVFAGLLELARASLSQRDFFKLERALA